MENAVERAIECIRERYGKPLTLTDIAESALLSRFYFTRLFKEETGLTPGRFLAAVRIFHAKRLIETTAMSITDISYAVGYNSLGSFTNSFTASVGVSPSRFRRLARDGGEGLPGPEPNARAEFGTVAGTISLPEGHGNARVFLGAFRTPVVQHPSVAATLVDVPSGRPSCYTLKNVPEGDWHLLAVAVADGIGPDARARRTSLVGGHGLATVSVSADGVTSAAVRLRPHVPTDPPVLLALPELEPPASVTALPGCASVTPAPEGDGRRQAAGHLWVASAAPAVSRA
ncbi:helix-turn-helix domain-containing protein [Streptomyces sp. NBC_01551]|uniref:helix-turn-helix transcriptional regulator n=1 Tax=Streptomyces sp. NBC_01551 TaxID=2975876 RepID=UPI002257161E|nr:helix-turn-helix domain-containing protein [Streptomyces sp. NBC_01551]MCX4527155.1 helix-turn-helix domain-containing protein [Streptomyces sp. NBC_01551]